MSSGEDGSDLLKAHTRICGVSGLVFAVLLVVALILVRQTPGLAEPESAYADFYNNGNGGVLVTVGLYIVPFAGVAFLWHVATTRALILPPGSSESRTQPFLQLGSGILFVATIFVGSALVGAIALLSLFSDNPPPSADVAQYLASAGYGVVFVYGVRAAGVYLLTTTTLARKRGLMPRPWAIVSYLAGVFLLVSTTFHPAVLLVFPAWVALMSVLALVRARKLQETHDEPAEPAAAG